MRAQFFIGLLFGLSAVAWTSTGLAAAGQSKSKVSHETTKPGGQVSWGADQVALVAGSGLKVGQKFPKIQLRSSWLEKAHFGGAGAVRLVSVVPSIDTPVCETQTHVLSETDGVAPSVQRITISRDLPFAQRRFREKSKLQNITYLSDLDLEFGRTTGLLIPKLGILARGVLVLDRQGVVRHLQIVPDTAQLPDMSKAIGIANQIAKEVSR